MSNYKYLFIAVLVVAFLIRLSAITYGLPFAVFGDEIIQVSSAFNLLEQHTLRPNFPLYYLPPLFSYLLAPCYALYGVLGMLTGKFHGIADFRGYVLLHYENFLVMIRLFGALFGTASLAVFFLVARKFFDKYFSLLAMVLLAFDFLHLQESMTGRFWVPVTFFMLAGIYSIIRIYESGEARWHVFAALAVGFGFGMGYVAVLLFPWFWMAHFLRNSSFSFFEKIKQKRFLLGNAISIFLIAFFSYANVYAFVRQFGFSGAILLNVFGVIVNTSFKRGIPQDSHILRNLIEIATNFRDLNPVLFMLAIVGLLMFVFSRRAWFEKTVVVGVPLAYLAGIAFVFPWIDHRYMLPAYLFFLLGAVYVLEALWNVGYYAVFARFVSGALFTGMLLFPLGLDVLYVRLLFRPDTAVQAAQWIEHAVSDGSSVISNLRLSNNKDGIVFWRDHDLKNSIDVRSRFLLSLDPKQYPKPSYFLYDANYLDPSLFTKDRKIDFIVCSFNAAASCHFLDALPYKKELIKTFYPEKEMINVPNLYGNIPYPYSYLPFADNLGSYVEIYKVIK